MQDSIRRIVHTPHGLARFIDDLQRIELPVEIEVHAVTDRRTRKQNSTYRRWVALIAAEVGEDPERMHQILAHRFLPKSVETIRGEVVELPLSTREMTVSQMMNYMDQIQILAAEYGIVLDDLPE